MLTAIAAFALLASSEGLPAVNLGKTQSDHERVVCKYDLEPGSRLVRRKTCLTVAQWRDWKRTEQLNLLRHQYNGAQ